MVCRIHLFGDNRFYWEGVAILEMKKEMVINL
jgi:hypothetical protein